jgi:hypothetical protein
MVLELDKLNSYYVEQEALVEKMRNDLEFWLFANGLYEQFRISKLNRFHVVLESFDVSLDESLLRDFEVVFGVACETIKECKVRDLSDGQSFVKYSYYFRQSGGIF